MSLEELMAARHHAYVKAREVSFKPGKITSAWRRANRDYMKGRDKGVKIEVETPFSRDLAA